VIFAWHQDVNLVHKDYYEKGVDYSAQIDKETRSVPFANLIGIDDLQDSVRIRFLRELTEHIDSGKVLFFRPSDHNLDLSYTMQFRDTLLGFKKTQMVSGKYIVKMTWFSGGVDYEVDRIVVIN
jgi:hypothetical protein